MNVRRSKAIWLALACCAGAMLAGFLLSQRSQPDLQLVFVRYTNVMIEARPGYRAWMTKAIIEVTNCGSVPVVIAPLWQAYPISQMQIPVELGGSYLVMPTLQLNSGKAESVVTHLAWKENGRFKIDYTSPGWMESLAAKARNSRHASVRNLANKLFPTAKLRWAYSGLITNPHSPARVSRYHISAPPPEIPTELLQTWKRQ